MAVDFMPDCGDADCKHAKIVWRDGKRYVEYDDNYVPFDQYVRVMLQAISDDVIEIRKRLDELDKYKGLVP